MTGLLAFTSFARADSDSSVGSADIDPETRTDPDGVPLSLSEKKPERATPAEIAADRKLRAQAAIEKDWMLRAYEKQLQTHDSTSTSLDKEANPYQEVSANKDLAKLAGLTDYHADHPDDEPLYRTKNALADHADVRLRPGSGSTAPNFAGAFGSSFLKPLASPLSAPDTAGLKNFYASLPDAGVSAFNGSTPVAALKPRTSVIADPTDNDIETPGMIAAKNSPGSDPATSDLDVLPGESIEHAQAHQDNSEQLLQLPMAMDADQLHRAQAASLSPSAPRAADANQAAKANAAKPAAPPQDNYSEPVPVNAMPVINPVRAPVANPYDILNR